MRTIKDQLENGFTLSLDGTWVSSTNGRATEGGNFMVSVMKASLDPKRLQALASNGGMSIEALLTQIVQAAQFVGAYQALIATEKIAFEDGPSAKDDALIRAQIKRASLFSGF